MSTEFLPSEIDNTLNIETPRVYDWALGPDEINRFVSADRIMLTSSIIGVGANVSCRFGLDVQPAVALGIGTVSLFGGALLLAYVSIREGLEIN